jgi:hypothetical protein
MSRKGPLRPSRIGGSDTEDAALRLAIIGGQVDVSTDEQTVYRGRRDPTAPVGEECTVTVDGEQCLNCRYDLLSASPTGFEWNYRGSGPAQLAIALLAHAFSDEFACEHYEQFKDEVISVLPEHGWTLTKIDLDARREEVTVDA